MKKLLDTLLKDINKVVVAEKRNKTAEELAKMTDRQLADMGIARWKLELGARAYPWRDAANDDQSQTAA